MDKDQEIFINGFIAGAFILLGLLELIENKNWTAVFPLVGGLYLSYLIWVKKHFVYRSVR
jgi:hypothetical protein